MDSQLGILDHDRDYVAEIKKPDGERLEDYHDAQQILLASICSLPLPIYPAFEIARMTASLNSACRN